MQARAGEPAGPQIQAAQVRLATLQHAEDLSVEYTAQVIEDIQAGAAPALSLTRAARA